MIPSLKPIGSSVDIAEEDVFLIATGAGFSRGEVVQIPTDSDGGHTTCITPTAAGIGIVSSSIASDAAFGVVLGDINGFGDVAENGIAKVRVRGKVDAIVISTSDAAIAAEAPLFPNTSKQLEADQAGSDANAKLVAMNTTAVAATGTSTPTSRTVIFDGLVGFGRMGGTIS